MVLFCCCLDDGGRQFYAHLSAQVSRRCALGSVALLLLEQQDKVTARRKSSVADRECRGLLYEMNDGPVRVLIGFKFMSAK